MITVILYILWIFLTYLISCYKIAPFHIFDVKLAMFDAMDVILQSILLFAKSSLSTESIVGVQPNTDATLRKTIYYYYV